MLRESSGRRARPGKILSLNLGYMCIPLMSSSSSARKVVSIENHAGRGGGTGLLHEPDGCKSFRSSQSDINFNRRRPKGIGGRGTADAVLSSQKPQSVRLMPC